MLRLQGHQPGTEAERKSISGRDSQPWLSIARNLRKIRTKWRSWPSLKRAIVGEDDGSGIPTGMSGEEVVTTTFDNFCNLIKVIFQLFQYDKRLF